jgi:hypothetical protein
MITVKTESRVAYFIRSYREAIQALEEGKAFTWGSWKDQTRYTSKEQFHSMIQRDLNRKINTLGGIEQQRCTWRKWSSDYFYRCYRDQQFIQNKLNRRIRINARCFETSEAQQRYSHLIEEE